MFDSMVRSSPSCTPTSPACDRRAEETTIAVGEISIADAVAVAMDRLGLPDPMAVTVWRTLREDRPTKPYYLVVLGDPQRAEGVAAVDAVTGTVMEWAELPGTGAHLTTSSQEALRRAKRPSGRTALVWRPFRASTSMLSPVWRVSTDDDRRYVDQQGIVWESLQPDTTGG
jgi:hypothetical protein